MGSSSHGGCGASGTSATDDEPAGASAVVPFSFAAEPVSLSIQPRKCQNGRGRPAVLGAATDSSASCARDGSGPADGST